MNDATDANLKIKAALAAARDSIKSTEQPKLIGLGGGSLIYRMQSQLHGDVAVKILAFDRLPPERIGIARLQLRREGDVLGAISSNFVPRPISCQPQAGFLVRQFIEGETLAERIDGLKMSLNERISTCQAILVAAIDIFDAFHDSAWGPYVIRDFKPRNLIYRLRDHRVFLVDLGSVRSEAGMLSQKQTGHRVGTGSFKHWAPEQLLEIAESLDRRTDYFALGSTLYTTIYGCAPYSNNFPANQLLTEYEEHYSRVSMHLRSDADLPSGFAEFLVACLSPIAEQRPRSIPSLTALVPTGRET